MATAPTYRYYRDSYGGTAVPEAEWAHRSARAAAWLARTEALSTVTPWGDPDECRAMALCALADKAAELDAAAEDAEVSSVSVGSVSTSYDATRGGSIDLSPAGRERAMLSAVSPWLHVYLGVRRGGAPLTGCATRR